jgi:aryl-alcohol dehydrogenase-like predicted oxidoreductase
MLGASRAEQLRENLAAPEATAHLDAAAWKRVEAATAA